jgi:hypothetical protein
VDIQRGIKLVSLLNDSIVGTVSSGELRVNCQCWELNTLIFIFFNFIYIYVNLLGENTCNMSPKKRYVFSLQ